MLILHFVYTREVEINKKTVGPLLKCADELGICELVRMCVEFLSCINCDNAIYFYAIADNYGLAELKETIYGFILENFLGMAVSDTVAVLGFCVWGLTGRVFLFGGLKGINDSPGNLKVFFIV